MVIMQDLTKGSILKTLVLFTLPLFAGKVLNTLYNIVDTIFVGRLGHQAIGAVSLSYNLIFVFVALAAGLTLGSSILISQYYGAKDLEKVNLVIENSVVFIGLLAVVLSALGIIFSPNILKLMGAPEDIYPLSLGYMRIVFAGIILMFGFFIVSAVLRGLGDSKTPLKFLVVSTSINIILDPLLIFGIGPFPELGVNGAALATVIAQGVAAVIGFYYLIYRAEYLDISFKNFKFNKDIIKDILKLGFPSGIAQMLMALGGTVVISIISDFGSIAVATHGIGMKANSLSFMLIQSFGMATATMVGQNIGAKKMDRVYLVVKNSIILNVIVAAFFTLIYFSFPMILVRIFTDDPVMFQPTVTYIRIVSLGYIFYATMNTLNSVVRGAGAMLQSMLIIALNLWVIRVPLATLLSNTYGVVGIWQAISISFVMGAIMSFFYYKFGDWESKSVVKDSIIEPK